MWPPKPETFTLWPFTESPPTSSLNHYIHFAWGKITNSGLLYNYYKLGCLSVSSQLSILEKCYCYAHITDEETEI